MSSITALEVIVIDQIRRAGPHSLVFLGPASLELAHLTECPSRRHSHGVPVESTHCLLLLLVASLGGQDNLGSPSAL